MLRLSIFCSLILLSATSAHADATELGVARFEQGVIPILVSVDKQGKVTNLLSSAQLKPSMERLMRQTVDEVIVSPGHFNGKPTNTQLVLRMKFEATPRADGNYDGRFVPVEAKQVPYGAWAWRIDGDRYALSDDLGRSRPRLEPPVLRDNQPRRFEVKPSPPPTTPPAPAVAQARPSKI